MAFPILIALVVFASGCVVGRVTRSWWSVLYPVLFVVFTIDHVLTRSHVYDMGQGTKLTLFTLMYILPATLGVGLAVSGPKLLKHRE